jgi:hypothetical protein
MSSVGSVIQSVYPSPMFGVETIWAKARQYLRSVICRIGQRAYCVVLQFTVYAVSFSTELVFLIW